MLEKNIVSPLDCKEIQPVHPKGNQSWIFTRRTDVEAETPNTLATWCKELTCLKRPWCWERLKAGGGGGNRGWGGWMASPTQWTWVWVNSELVMDRKSGVLQSMGSQKVRHNWVTELNWFWFGEHTAPQIAIQFLLWAVSTRVSICSLPAKGNKADLFPASFEIWIILKVHNNYKINTRYIHNLKKT